MGNKSSSAKTSCTVLEDSYVVSNHKLGRGHYATVWEGKQKSTQKGVAIKRIKKSLTDEKRLRTEIRVLQTIGSHDNIVELIDVFETRTEVQLVMELCTGGVC